MGVVHLRVYAGLRIPETKEMHSRPTIAVGQRLHEHGLICPTTSCRYHTSIQPLSVLELCGCLV